MTTAFAPSTTAAGTFWWRAGVLIAPIGPLAIAVLRGILPYRAIDDPVIVIEKVAAAPGASAAVLWLGYLALLTLPLGVLIVGALAVRARPVLGGVAAVIAWFGFTSMAFIVAVDQTIQGGIDAGLPAATVAAVTVAVEGSAAASTAVGLFVIGHILGAVLLGVALWRVIPRWAAVALIGSQPLHLVFAVIVPNPLLDMLAWTLTAVGFAAAAAHAWRRPTG